MPLALYVREANVEPHASPREFILCLLRLGLPQHCPPRCSYTSLCRPYNETVIPRRTWLIRFAKTTLVVPREYRLSRGKRARDTFGALGRARHQHTHLSWV